MSEIFKFIGEILDKSDSWFGSAGIVVKFLEKLFGAFEG